MEPGKEAGEECFLRADPDISIPMAWIPAGEFRMGNQRRKSMYDGFAGIQKKVIISEGFWMSKHKICEAHFRKISKHLSASILPQDASRFPAIAHAWAFAMEFCSALEGRISKDGEHGNRFSRVRLPSHAEWEYACRAGTTGEWFFGEHETMLNEYAWYAGNSGAKLHPSGQLRPNPWGLYDMYGNIGEWVLDYLPMYLLREEDKYIDPVSGNPETDEFASIRGGDCTSPATGCSSSSFFAMQKNNPMKEHFGFRILVSAVSHPQSP